MYCIMHTVYTTVCMIESVLCLVDTVHVSVLRMETLLGVSELVAHQETANLVRNLQKRNMSKDVNME